MINIYKKKYSYFEMATVSTSELKYGLIIKIGGAGEEKGGQQEHNPPHFHILQVSTKIEIKVKFSDLKIYAVYQNKKLVKKGADTSWSDDFNKLKFSDVKVIVWDWLKQEAPVITQKGEVLFKGTNFQYCGYMWNHETEYNTKTDKVDWQNLKLE